MNKLNKLVKHHFFGLMFTFAGIAGLINTAIESIFKSYTFLQYSEIIFYSCVLIIFGWIFNAGLAILIEETSK